MKARSTGAKHVMAAAAATVLALSLSGSAPASSGSNHQDGAFSPALSPALAQAVPPGEVTVDVLSVNGSGCPAGTATVTVSPDNTGFRVNYRRYLAKVGGGAGPTDFRKNCQLGLSVHVPHGFTYAVARADYRGLTHLAAGATGLMRANYYLQGSPGNTYANHPFTGPYHARWHRTDITDTAVWAPCGIERILNINTELRVYAGKSNPDRTPSWMVMRSADGSIDTVYHFAWARC
jgi:Domain of unknown function (DUF4360)